MLLEDLQSHFNLYLTSLYPCAYLPEHEARSQVAIACSDNAALLTNELINKGFRRSGHFIYRPRCHNCQDCVAVRIPVHAFTPSRSQRRAQRRHQDLLASERPLVFDEDHFTLYRRYQCARHPGGGMDQDDRKQYEDDLLRGMKGTRLVEFRDPGAANTLRIVSIIDPLSNGLSSVYTFYDPTAALSSFGTYAILWQIEACRRLRLPYLYLGYWIRQSPKMAYKIRFQPLEGLIAEQWQRLNHPLPTDHS